MNVVPAPRRSRRNAFVPMSAALLFAVGGAGVYGATAVADSGDVAVTFRLSGISTKNDGAVYVAGNVPALGSWDPAAGVRLTRMEDGVWTATAHLPAHELVEYRYVITNMDAAAWERDGATTGTERSFTTPAAGTLARRDGDAHFDAADLTILIETPVTFELADPALGATLRPDQSIRVVGNARALGSWDPAHGFTLTRVAGSPTWKGSVPMPANTSFQYKFVLWDGKTPVWEHDQPTSSKNRELTTPESGAAAQQHVDGFSR